VKAAQLNDRLSRMDPHSHVQLGSVRPAVLGEGSLRVNGGTHRVLRTPEGDEEGVTLGVDLDAAVFGERFAE
jgi:hypothetical protein